MTVTKPMFNDPRTVTGVDVAFDAERHLYFAPGGTMNIRYFVNDKTRMCQMLSGQGADHEQNVIDALKSGFRSVTLDQMEAFRADTKAAKDAGWNPNGRISYAKFVERRHNAIRPISG